MEILSEAKLFWTYLQKLQIAQYSGSQMVVCVLVKVNITQQGTLKTKVKGKHLSGHHNKQHFQKLWHSL